MILSAFCHKNAPPVLSPRRVCCIYSLTNQPCVCTEAATQTITVTPAISRIVQGNAARIQREIHAARPLQMQGVATDNQIDGVSAQGFTGGAAEIEHVGCIQSDGVVCQPVRELPRWQELELRLAGIVCHL